MLLADQTDEITLAAVVGWAIAVGSAVWGWWRNRGLSRQLTQARNEVTSLPEKLAEELDKALGPTEGAMPLADVGFLDVTSDDEPEILIQRGVGAHSSILTVMGKTHPFDDFDTLGELFNDTGAPFHVVDWDDDGRREIRTIATDLGEMERLMDTGAQVSMADAPAVEKVWRWSDEQRAFLESDGERWPFKQPRPERFARLQERPDWPLRRP